VGCRTQSSPARVELEVHRQPRCEAAASPSDTASAAAGPAAPLVLGIAGRTCEYCRQWLQDRAAREAASGAGAAVAAAPPFVTHMYHSADGVPPLHAVMTDSYGRRSSAPRDAALYLLLTINSCRLAFSLPDGRVGCESCARCRSGRLHDLAVDLWRHWHHLMCRHASIVPRLFMCTARAGKPPYEVVLGLGKVR
jgi:hypothetical protein